MKQSAGDWEPAIVMQMNLSYLNELLRECLDLQQLWVYFAHAHVKLWAMARCAHRTSNTPFRSLSDHSHHFCCWQKSHKEGMGQAITQEESLIRVRHQFPLCDKFGCL